MQILILSDPDGCPPDVRSILNRFASSTTLVAAPGEVAAALASHHPDAIFVVLNHPDDASALALRGVLAHARAELIPTIVYAYHTAAQGSRVGTRIVEEPGIAVIDSSAALSLYLSALTAMLQGARRRLGTSDQPAAPQADRRVD